jgi:dihydrofolate synthase/folylpolyglutamate synthase
MTFKRYLDAERELNEGLIRLEISRERENLKNQKLEAKVAEMRDFLSECGDPQKEIPAVHVAGTSGKGSVAAAVAGILSEAGLKMGLHVSPYLQSSTEKIWIQDRFVSSDCFADLVDWVMPIAKPRVNPETPASIHGMASIAIAMEGFRREGVDAVVFEVGCGGRFDLTSFVETKVAVITNVGMDHLVSLGPTLQDIAWRKAGVARSDAPLITGARGEALGPIRREAKEVGARLIEIPGTGDAFSHNRALAVEAASQMAKILGVDLNERILKRGLKRVRLAGRSEVVRERGPRIILDGAHNEEKLSVAVKEALKDAGPGPKVGVFGFLGTKATSELMRPLIGKFDHLIATQPEVYAKTSHPADLTAELLSTVASSVLIEPDMFAALEAAIENAGNKGTVLVSGSFYLVGDIRERWYPKEKVVLERTSWPQSAAK